MPRAGLRSCRSVAAVLDPDRFFDPDPAVRRVARELYEETRGLPIVSPHGHVDPGILARDEPFAEPAALIVQPDHYILRLLYARGVPLEALGVPRRDRAGGDEGAGGPGGAGGALPGTAGGEGPRVGGLSA